MRLSEWRKTAPNKNSMSNRVLAVLRPVLVDLGSEPDAECWVVWGDDPESRYSVLVSTMAGLITAVVRPADPEGPRVTAKLIRWSKVSVSELGVEASWGHRLVGIQVESLVLKGVDQEADRVAHFVRGLIAGIENRGAAPVAVIQGSAVVPSTSIVALSALAGADGEPDGEPELAPELEPEPAPQPESEEEPVQVVAGTDQAGPASDAGSMPVAIGSPKVVPIASKTASRPAARAVVNTKGGDPVAAPKRPRLATPATESVKPQPDQPEWVGPHPIEDQAPPPRPRPWMP